MVTAAEGDHCFAIPSLDVEKRVRASRPLEVDVAFERTGEFPFLCCSEGPGTTETGVVVVTAGAKAILDLPRTLEMLAERADLHANYVGAVERGERNLSLYNIWRLAQGLGLAADELMQELPARKGKR